MKSWIIKFSSSFHFSIGWDYRNDFTGALAITIDVLWFLSTVIAARRLHKFMLFNILRTPLSFFDVTPVGRLLSRFSGDVETVDEEIPYDLLDIIMCTAEVKSWFKIQALVLLWLSGPFVNKVTWEFTFFKNRGQEWRHWLTKCFYRNHRWVNWSVLVHWCCECFSSSASLFVVKHNQITNEFYWHDSNWSNFVTLFTWHWNRWQWNSFIVDW